MVRTCPECGGEMVYDRRRGVWVCRHCGLTFSRFDSTRKGNRKQNQEDEDAKKREYLKWWLSSKKK